MRSCKAWSLAETAELKADTNSAVLASSTCAFRLKPVAPPNTSKNTPSPASIRPVPLANAPLTLP